MSFVNTTRTKAYEVLADKKAVSQARVKTKMCKETMAGKRCYIKNCGFAHSKTELQLPVCLFKDNCRTLKNPYNPCSFVHPCDTPESYKLRTGNPWPLDVVVPKLIKKISHSEQYFKNFQQIQEKMVKDEIEMLESIRQDEIKMEEERDRLLKGSVEEDLIKSMEQLNVTSSEDESSDEERLVFLLTHQDKVQWEAKEALRVSSHVPERNINVTLTPEQFKILLPHLINLKVSFSTQ